MKPALSDRELQVLDFAAQGHTDEMIAKALGIGKGTVNSYWVRIRGKMGHLSRTHLVANHLQSKSRAEIAANLATSNRAASDQAEESMNRLNAERSKHQAEIDARQEVADDLAEQNKRIIEKAEVEIERLRKLLKSRRK